MKMPNDELAAELLRRLIAASRAGSARLEITPHDFNPPRTIAEIAAAAHSLQPIYTRCQIEKDRCSFSVSPDLAESYE